MKAMVFKRRAAFGTFGLAALGTLLGALCARPEAIVERTIERVPQAKSALEFRGKGFAAKGKSGFASDAAGAAGQSAAHTLQVRAPEKANGTFQLTDGAGAPHGSLRLPNAAPERARVENGALVYADAYAGVDVVMVRDLERFEVSYVSKTDAVPALQIAVGADDGELSIERDTGAAVLRGPSGRPRLRASRPVAFDASGSRREGSYVLADARTLKVEVDVRSMTPPIVIDPAFYIPFWTLQEEGRGPGNLAYDKKTQSREGQIVFNTKTGKPWLIRPLQSLTHYSEIMGSDRPDEWYSKVSPTPRTSGQNGPAPDPQAVIDFQRTVGLESETYEWNDDGWRLLPHVGLPNLIDPAFSFDTGRGRAVAFSGRLQGAGEQTAWLAGSAVFENDGTGWSAKGAPGAPTPRQRAAAVGYGSKTLLFGGRVLPTGADISGGQLARTDLLNDTWLYDGKAWEKVAVSNPPPACEAAQLVHDTRRDRVVLVGGNCAVEDPAFNPSDNDGFRLWEFDGKDWTRRFDLDDPALPRSFRPRRGVAAAFNPVRGTTMLFGGFVDVTEICPYTSAELETKRYDARIADVINHDMGPTLQLQQQGCWGGYVHDTWEWDGTTLKALTRVAYGAQFSSNRAGYAQVFQQVSGAIPPPAAAVDARAPATTTKLWPWRYNASAQHFAQRSALERGAAEPGVPNAPATSASAQISLATGSGGTIVSPMFLPGARPQLLVKPDGKMLVFSSDDGRVLETDLATWTDRTPSKTPFASGQHDLFAVAWDSSRQKAVLFDPITAATWEHDDAGWRRIQTSSSPGVWSVDKSSRQFRDGPAYPRLPRMSFDRARARTLMLYGDALWEYDGTTWLERTAPAALRGCVTTTLMRFDGARARTVVVGCTAEGPTWEWDGNAWLGPFASPFQGKVARVYGAGAANLSFRATLQLAYTHPDALFESTALGGVGIVDAGGYLRIWNGITWQQGAYFGDPTETDAEHNYTTNLVGSAFQNSTGYYPPVVEDFGAHRLLAFRDGIRGLRELPLLPQPATSFVDSFVGDIDHVSGGVRVHPFPSELLPLDIVGSQGFHAPGSETLLDGTPTTRSIDSSYANLAWAFRLLPDPTTHRVRVLTNRGNFWELGSERVNDVGETCTTSADCKDGAPCQQGVCCSRTCNGLCLTCNGAHPGTCEAAATGAPGPQNRCGAGECGGVCSGIAQTSNGFPVSSCTFPAGRTCGTGATCSNGQITGAGSCAANGPTCVMGPPTPVACGGGLKCTDDTSCKAACSSSADCQQPYQVCSGDGTRCVPDGKVCHNNGECPKFNKCNADGQSCIPDAVLAAAAAHGVTPAQWQAAPARTPEDVATILKQRGFPEDPEGRIRIPGAAFGDVEIVFNPRRRDPLMGFRACRVRIQACFQNVGDWDECVAGTPRCESSTPWSGDPAGDDCCPTECLVQYFDARDTKNALESLGSMGSSSCYPGLNQQLEGSQ